jgi:hypothetical protein
MGFNGSGNPSEDQEIFREETKVSSTLPPSRFIVVRLVPNEEKAKQKKKGVQDLKHG